MTVVIENKKASVASEPESLGIDDVYTTGSEIAGRTVVVCPLESVEKLIAPGRAQQVITAAEQFLGRKDPRETLFICNDQLTIERILPEYPDLLDTAKEALAKAALGESIAPLVLENPDQQSYPNYIAIELHPDSNTVIIRRAVSAELVERGEPPEGWNPLPFLASNTEPYEPVGGLQQRADGYMYDTLGIFPRFPTGSGKLSIAFIPPGVD